MLKDTVLRYITMNSAWGWLAVAAGELGLRALVLPCLTEEEAEAALLLKVGTACMVRDVSVFGDLPYRLLRYFGGERLDFAAEETDWTGSTPFQRGVLTVVRKIPYGEVRSYKWVAEQLRCRAYRAVGQALSANPLPVIIPCHRVIGQTGELGGFSEGPTLKERLLNLEGWCLEGTRVTEPDR